MPAGIIVNFATRLSATFAWGRASSYTWPWLLQMLIGLAALVLFTWGQVCPNVKLLRNESRNAFLGALRRKPTVQQTTADGAAPPRPARTTRTTTVHPPFWL